MSAPALRVVRDPAGLPPAHDYAAECVVLGAILIDDAALDRVVDIVAAHQFYQANHQAIFAAAVALSTAGKPTQTASIGTYLRERGELEGCGGAAYLAELMNNLEAGAHRQLEHYARVVREKHRVRTLAATCQRIAAECYAPIDDVQTMLDAAEHAVGEVARAPEHGSIVTITTSITSVFSAIEAAADRGDEMTGLPTGFAQLDALTAGLHPAEHTVIAGRPGMGKTAFGMAVALNVASLQRPRAKRPGVLFVSLEMSHAQLTTRTICSEAKVSLSRVRTSNLQRDEWARLAQAGQWLSTLPLWIDDRSGMTPLELRAKARRLKAELARTDHTELALVVVDYLQLINARSMVSKQANREEAVSVASQALKDLSKDLNVPVIAMAQVGRDSEKSKEKRPGLADLRESGAIEQNADNVIFVYREEYHLKDRTPADKRGVAELIVAKQRNGPTDTAFTRWHAEHALFADGTGGAP